ncbi:MAG: sugar ABC transporter permease [Firmicutes bacterium]|jgi:raffinose/stachyose/melibiose transport system permease protein|nr:sugar ABC transporter permease [Bacillota bacterium]
MDTAKSFLKKLRTFLIFAGPTTFVFLFVVIFPFIFGIYLSLTNWDGIASVYRFIGFSNYLTVFQDQFFWNSFLLTVKYVLYTVIFVNLIAFTLAYLLTSGIKGEEVLRAGFFVPNLIGGIVLGLIWHFVFSRALVFLGKSLNLELFSYSWLANPQKALWTLVIVSVWQYSGYMMLIHIAGLVNIPKEVIEAALIDGANDGQRIIRIILPLMVPSFVVSMFLTLQRGFMVYDVNLALTNGGPFRSTELISMHVYKKAFLAQEYGIGQSQAFILFIIVAAITLTQVYFSKKLEVEM